MWINSRDISGLKGLRLKSDSSSSVKLYSYNNGFCCCLYFLECTKETQVFLSSEKKQAKYIFRESAFSDLFLNFLFEGGGNITFWEKVCSWNNCIKLKIVGIERKNAWSEESQTVDLGFYIWLKTYPEKEENKILIGYIKNPVNVIWKAAVFYGVRTTSFKRTHFVSFLFLRT